MTDSPVYRIWNKNKTKAPYTINLNIGKSWITVTNYSIRWVVHSNLQTELHRDLEDRVPTRSSQSLARGPGGLCPGLGLTLFSPRRHCASWRFPEAPGRHPRPHFADPPTSSRRLVPTDLGLPPAAQLPSRVKPGRMPSGPDAGLGTCGQSPRFVDSCPAGKEAMQATVLSALHVLSPRRAGLEGGQGRATSARGRGQAISYPNLRPRLQPAILPLASGELRVGTGR